MKKKIIAILLVCIMFLPQLCCAETVYTGDRNIYNTFKNISFTDVAYKPVDHWSSTAIYFMASIGAMKGYNGNFDMTSPVKNHEAMAVLFRCAGAEDEAEILRNSVADFKVQNPGVYNDLDPWADGYLRLAVDKGLISSIDFLSSMEIEYLTNPNPFFRKDAPAKRADLARWMVIVFGLEKASKENMIIDFEDYSSIKEEDKLYLETAVNCGMLKGADGYLNPYSTLTREEMAQMFYNIYSIWAKAGGYEIVQDTISDITVDTTKNSTGEKLDNIKTITVGDVKVETRFTYNLIGEVVDTTVYEENTYEDFPVIKDKQLPSDSSVLTKGEEIILFLKGSKVACAIQPVHNETAQELNTAGYDESVVYSGKLYYYDKEDKIIVIENSEGGYTEIPLFPGAEFFKRENLLDADTVNSMYTDQTVYIFTVRKSGTETDRGYRVQIL